jgi:hypothetical protein
MFPLFFSHISHPRLHLGSICKLLHHTMLTTFPRFLSWIIPHSFSSGANEVVPTHRLSAEWILLFSVDCSVNVNHIWHKLRVIYLNSIENNLHVTWRSAVLCAWTRANWTCFGLRGGTVSLFLCSCLKQTERHYNLCKVERVLNGNVHLSKMCNTEPENKKLIRIIYDVMLF